MQKEEAKKQAELNAIEQEERAERFILELRQYYFENTRHGSSYIDIVKLNRLVPSKQETAINR